MEQLIIAALMALHQIRFAVLVGSRALGCAQLDSDWDIAVELDGALSPIERYELLADLQIYLASQSGIHPDAIDLIDLHKAGLAMREQVANHGRLLKGENTLAWSHFLVKTWRELEVFEWEKRHVA